MAELRPGSARNRGVDRRYEGELIDAGGPRAGAAADLLARFGRAALPAPPAPPAPPVTDGGRQTWDLDRLAAEIVARAARFLGEGRSTPRRTSSMPARRRSTRWSLSGCSRGSWTCGSAWTTCSRMPGRVASRSGGWTPPGLGPVDAAPVQRRVCGETGAAVVLEPDRVADAGDIVAGILTDGTHRQAALSLQQEMLARPTPAEVVTTVEELVRAGRR